MPCSPPKGFPSIHAEGEARQLKTNPFPTQSYPTRKRQVQPISSNKPRDGRVGEKVCYVQCCGGDLQPLTLTNSTQFLQALKGRPSIGHLSSPLDSEREDLQRMLEIFLGRSTIRFVVEPLRLARSLKLVVASGLLVPRGTRVPPTTDRDRCTQQCRTANSLY